MSDALVSLRNVCGVTECSTSQSVVAVAGEAGFDSGGRSLLRVVEVDIGVGVGLAAAGGRRS